jgi:hypothetical protein
MFAAPSAIDADANAIIDMLDDESLAGVELNSSMASSPWKRNPDVSQVVSDPLESADWFE